MKNESIIHGITGSETIHIIDYSSRCYVPFFIVRISFPSPVCFKSLISGIPGKVTDTATSILVAQGIMFAYNLEKEPVNEISRDFGDGIIVPI